MKKIYSLCFLFLLAISSQAQSIVITEIMYNSPESGTDSLEFIEIYNNSGGTINLEGYHIDDAFNFIFPNFTMFDGDYIIIAGNGDAYHNVYGLYPNLSWTSGSLNNSGETITLYDSLDVLVDSVTYATTAPWPSQGDGDGYSIQLCSPTLDNSLGENWLTNTQGFAGVLNGVNLYCTIGYGANCYASPLVINEIMYNSPESGVDSLEFIELNNTTSNDVNLLGYTFTSGIDFTFPEYLIGSGNHIVLAKDSIAFTNFYGISPTFQWTSGSLSNTGEAIVIKDTLSNILDSVNYSNVAPWPTSADGLGYSLSLCDITKDNELGSNWSADSTLSLYRGTVNSVDVYASPFGDCGIVIVNTKDLNKLNKGFMLFPNPAQNMLNVKLTDTPSQVEIFDMKGNKLFSKSNITSSANISLSEWNAGIYIISVKNINGTNYSKFVKQ